MATNNGHKTYVDQYIVDWLSQTTSSAQPPPPFDRGPPLSDHIDRKRKRVDEGEELPRSRRRFLNHYSDTDTFSCGVLKEGLYCEHSNILQSSHSLPGNTCQMEEPADRSSMSLVIPRLSAGTSSVYDSPGSAASVNSKTSVKRKLEALEFNGTPTLAWHLMLADLPDRVSKLMARLTLSAVGCESIPSSLRENIESDPNLVSEAFPPFIWQAPNNDVGDLIPTPTDIGLWEFVQDIVKQSRLLAAQKVEESEYYPLVRKILNWHLNGSNLEVKHVTAERFNPRHLPQGPLQGSPTKRSRSGTNNLTSPVLDVKVDLSIEYKLPNQLTDNPSLLLHFSLLAALKRAFGSTWVCGPYPRLSVVACVVEVKTSIAASRLKAEFQAAVGGVCMIQARMELVDEIKKLANDAVLLSDGSHKVDKTLLDFNFPVVTLVIMGDTWYYQVVYLRKMSDCIVLPIRMAGDTLTHAGVFRLLKFVDAMRVWCLEYATEFILLLRALGIGVGWRED